MQVTLAWFELQVAAIVGVCRHIEAIRSHRKDRYGAQKETGWQLHIEGACGEAAFAKAVNRWWSGSINTFADGGDVGRVQVRTRSRETYDLIVRPSDRDSDVFVLMTGAAPTYKVEGWIRGRDAKRDIWLRTHGGRDGAYFVPKEALKKFEAEKRKEVA